MGFVFYSVMCPQSHHVSACGRFDTRPQITLAPEYNVGTAR